jgi:hypothetical protein
MDFGMSTLKEKRTKRDPLAELTGRVRFLELESEQWNRIYNNVLDWATYAAVAILAIVLIAWSAR